MHSLYDFFFKQIQPEVQGLPYPEMVYAFWQLLVEHQGQGHRGTGRHPGDFFVKLQFDDLLVEAQLNQLISRRHDPIKAVEVCTESDDFHMRQLKNLGIKIDQVITHHTFPKIPCFDHDDHLMGLSLSACLFTDPADGVQFTVKTDISIPDHLRQIPLRRRLDVNRLYLRVNFFNFSQVADPGVMYLPYSQINQFFEIQFVAT